MNIIEAVRRAFEGNHIRRPIWNDGVVVLVEDRRLWERQGDGRECWEFAPDAEAILADDWVVVKAAEGKPTP